jgi:hypothetical protein
MFSLQPPRHIPTLPIVGRPSPLVRALILVEKPPRERPGALRSAPLFHQPRTFVAVLGVGNR